MNQIETDVWVDKSAALQPGGRCTVTTADRCIDGPGTKIIDGREVTRDCWSYERTLTCTGAAPLEFTDHVGTPLQEGLQLLRRVLAPADGERIIRLVAHHVGAEQSPGLGIEDRLDEALILAQRDRLAVA